MADSPNKFGLGDYEENKAFSLKSGNKPSFREMGSSPLLGLIADGLGVVSNLLGGSKKSDGGGGGGTPSEKGNKIIEMTGKGRIRD